MRRPTCRTAPAANRGPSSSRTTNSALPLIQVFHTIDYQFCTMWMWNPLVLSVRPPTSAKTRTRFGPCSRVIAPIGDPVGPTAPQQLSRGSSLRFRGRARPRSGWHRRSSRPPRRLSILTSRIPPKNSPAMPCVEQARRGVLDCILQTFGIRRKGWSPNQNCSKSGPAQSGIQSSVSRPSPSAMRLAYA